MSEKLDRDNPLVVLAAKLSALADPSDQRTARLLARDEALVLRLGSRRNVAHAKLFESLARFGGGSLLTAVLLLMLGGKHDGGVVALAVVTLFCFAGGTIWSARRELSAIRTDYVADRLEAVLKESER